MSGISLPTLAELTDRLICDVALDREVDLNFAGWRVRVATNASALIERLRRYFEPFVAADHDDPDCRIVAVEAPDGDLGLTYTLKARERGKSKIKEEWVDLVGGGRVIRKRTTGMIFAFGGATHVAYGRCAANDNQVINFIISRYIQWRLHRGGMLYHAAGAIVDGRGLAMAGFSGMGKSTLALHLMSRGATFVSNDRLIVERRDDRLAMYGVPKLPRINPGTAMHNADLRHILSREDMARFGAMGREELWGHEEKYDVFIDEAYGAGRFALDAPMAGLILLNWDRYGSGALARRVDLAERPDLFPAFSKPTGLFFEPSPADPEPDVSDDAYRSDLGDCPVIEMTGGVDFETAAEICLELLRNG
jgi:HprK-related kinase B